MGYEFSNYAWHYWRPGWRIIQQSDAPEELKKLLKDAFLVAGDRLAFCRSWARVNGNSFALIPHALRYCMAATGDPLQKELFETYFDRFENGGWGERGSNASMTGCGTGSATRCQRSRSQRARGVPARTSIRTRRSRRKAPSGGRAFPGRTSRSASTKATSGSRHDERTTTRSPIMAG